MLENGAGLDIKSAGESPMKYVFSYWSADNKVLAQEEYELALYLIELGADIESNSIYGGHLIFPSVMRNNLMMVKHLIEDENLNIDLVDNDHKNSILMWAVESNRLEIVEYLLEQGADIHIVNADGKTAFDLAYEQENLENEELEKNMKIRELLSEK